MLTGQYSKANDVPYLDYPSPVLPAAADLPNVATVLQEAGYDVIWKGKWHLSFPVAFTGGPPDGETWSESDSPYLDQTYGMSDWNPPEAGNNSFDSEGARTTFGGGTADNDGRFASGVSGPDQTPGFGESAVEYLDRVGQMPPHERAPFCLFVSLVNPHDIAFYPNGWDTGGYDLADFEDLDIELPASADDDLTTKPSIQTTYRAALEDDGPLSTTEERLRFVRFYAYLHGVVDPHIGAILDALDRNDLTDDTVIFRTADHGEQGLAHGLREKSYNAYEETIHVPLVVSNPRLFPNARTTEALYSHVDLLATLAELAGAKPVGVGVSQVSVFKDPAISMQEAVLYTFDDSFILTLDEPGSHIRALRTPRWTYAVYFSADGSGFEYELYDVLADPDQMINLLFEPTEAVTPIWLELHRSLSKQMLQKQAAQEGFDWPRDPTGTVSA